MCEYVCLCSFRARVSRVNVITTSSTSAVLTPYTSTVSFYIALNSIIIYPTANLKCILLLRYRCHTLAPYSTTHTYHRESGINTQALSLGNSRTTCTAPLHADNTNLTLFRQHELYYRLNAICKK